MAKKQTLRTRKKKEYLFIACIFFIPILNFFIFNIGGLFNTITLGFQGYSQSRGYYWNNFANFKFIVKDIMANPVILIGLKNSLLFYVVHLIMLFVGLIVAYYIYKKFPGSKFFKVLFVMPGMVTGMVWVRLFKYFVQQAVPLLFGLDYGLLTDIDTIIPTLIGYGVWVGFAGGLIIFVGTMSGISEELIEAGRLDGNNMLKEFWYIVFPHVYPIVQVNLVVGVIGLFMDGPPLYDFYGTEAPHESVYSFNYYLKIMVLKSNAGDAEYALNSAYSLIITLIVAPLTYLARYLTTKFGPSED